PKHGRNGVSRKRGTGKRRSPRRLFLPDVTSACRIRSARRPELAGGDLPSAASIPARRGPDEKVPGPYQARSSLDPATSGILLDPLRTAVLGSASASGSRLQRRTSERRLTVQRARGAGP